jgi:hypothetical protein
VRAVKLADFATDLVAGNRYVKVGFGGFAGAGKSRTASEFVIGAYKLLDYTTPVLIVDNERGARFLIPAFKRAGVPARLKETTSLDDVLTAIDLLAAGEVQFLFIDSLTKVYYRYVRDYMQKNRRTFMQLDDWGKILPKWQETFSDAFVAAHGSIVFTGRGGYSYEKEEDTPEERDEAGNITQRAKKGGYVRSGVKMKLAGETPFEPDLNVWMQYEQEFVGGELQVWREAQVMKDRTGLIDGRRFKNPTFADFKPFLDYILDVPAGQVAGESSSRNIAPGENWDNYTRRTEKQIALEEIGEEIAKHYPGQTQDAKRARADCLEQLFETRSWTAVENLALEKLQAARNALWRITRGHDYGVRPPLPAGDPAQLTLVADGEQPNTAAVAQ